MVQIDFKTAIPRGVELRLLVCGSRTWDDAGIICAVLDGLWLDAELGYGTVHEHGMYLMEGGAPGADRIARWWAQNAPTHSYREHGLLSEGSGLPSDAPFTHLAFDADWDTAPHGAGVLRNQHMLVMGKPNLVVAFSDGFTPSAGTNDMLERARKACIPSYVVTRIIPQGLRAESPELDF